MSSATTAFKDNKEVTENAENLKSMKTQQGQDRKKTTASQDIGTLHYDGKQKTRIVAGFMSRSPNFPSTIMWFNCGWHTKSTNLFWFFRILIIQNDVTIPWNNDFSAQTRWFCMSMSVKKLLPDMNSWKKCRNVSDDIIKQTQCLRIANNCTKISNFKSKVNIEIIRKVKLNEFDFPAIFLW